MMKKEVKIDIKLENIYHGTIDLKTAQKMTELEQTREKLLSLQ